MLTSVMVSDRDNLALASLYAGQPQDVRSPGSKDAAEKQCIIIIEDNPGDVFIMEEALREHNVQCETTVLSDGEQAARFFDGIDNNAAAACPSIVLLDLNLPKRSGHWVLKRIRTGRRCPAVPVVIVSSSEAPIEMEQNRQLGATAYFKKPSNLEEFLKIGEVVTSLLANP